MEIKRNKHHTTDYKNNNRFSSKFKCCRPLQLLCILTLDIIEFFDNMHKENIEELVNPAVAEATE